MLSYLANVIDELGQQQKAKLAPVQTSNFYGDWECNWPELWKRMDTDCESIIQLSYQESCIGLMKIGLYPYPRSSQPANYVMISNLEALQGQARKVDPIGIWLIWYASKIALTKCIGDSLGSIVILDSYANAIPYYSSKVGMEGLGWTTISPTEEGYAFRFTQEGAQQFCSRVEQRWKSPQKNDPRIS